jgi:O-antigen/teichoic acid export membrane protein
MNWLSLSSIRQSRVQKIFGSRAMAGSVATGVIGQVILVASGVVLARALGPENRGLLALVFVLSAVATQVGSIGVPVAVTYWLASENAAAGALLRSLRKFRGFQLAVILVVQAGLVFVVLEPRSPSGFLWVGFLSLAATASGLSQMYGLAVLQGLSLFTAFNILRTLNGALYLAGVLSLWAIGEATLTSVTLVVIAASVLAATATSLVVLQDARRRGEEKDQVSTGGIVAFGLRSVVGSSPPLETYRLDQLLVGLVLPPVALGYFVVALAFTNLTRFIGQSIGMITYPRVATAQDPRDQRGIIRRDVRLAAAVCGCLTVVLIVAVPALLPLFFGSSFEPATTGAQILLVATFFAALRRILVDGTRGSGQPIWGATAETLTLLALPAVFVVTRYSDSVSGVALAIAGANLLGLLVIAPALLASKNPLESLPLRRDGSSVRSRPAPESTS